ncbi:MAG: bifunctional diaminohydroxyphosphoribosylaminopyrimidine deaminase/5-amino-6-(5-phosphoribosylamino)uracil reductase RibD [Bdellovibrionales bacterium]|nr:bifunctional diaminohydroxyphosphoribosylaminopyrimidine deaminase/5-amino-6-(5-phosphoribosylamino)uracil reductase RibD [Bdellovibrionales bacterium]
MAIEEGKKGLGFVAPNPAVGCVFLDSENKLLSKGYHRQYGKDHAEVDAYQSIKDKNKVDGGSVFVTLEPCAHQGKTPPCAQMLAGLPIKKFYYGVKDPNPVAAHGERVLKAAGKEVIHLKEMESQCEELAEIFLHNQKYQRPFVHVKIGATLDGQISLKSGDSQWITCQESRDFVQTLRGQYDAVLVGRKTFEVDNPRLNSRDPIFKDKQNHIVIVDSEGKSLSQLEKSQLLTVRSKERVWIVTDKKMGTTSSAQVISVEKQGKTLDLEKAFFELYKKGVTSILVEGGAYTISRLLEKQLVQRLSVFIAPRIMGAKSGISWTNDLSVSNLNSMIQTGPLRATQIGSDIFITTILKS